MKSAYLVPCRNKNKMLSIGISAMERCARSVLGQTTASELSIRFYDQGSTDGTFEILEKLCAESGLPDAKVMRCPEHKLAGTNGGMNIDSAWIIDQTPADFYLLTCADDYAHPQRAQRVIEAAAQTQASWIGTAQIVERNDGSVPPRRTYFPDMGTRWIAPLEAIQYQIGSSGSLAWSSELFRKHGPMRGMECDDVIFPMLSFAEKGFFFINEPLHTLVEYTGDLTNVGMEGKVRGARTPEEKQRLEELAWFFAAINWSKIYRRLESLNLLGGLSPEAQQALLSRCAGNLAAWVDARENLILSGLLPLGPKTLTEV